MSTEKSTTDTLRDTAAKGLDKAQGVLGSVLDSARKGLGTMQSATQTSEIPAGVALSRGLEFAEKNIAAAFEHAQKLVRAADVQEAVKLQTDYVKTQFGVMKEQAEELAKVVETKVEEVKEKVAGDKA